MLLCNYCTVSGTLIGGAWTIPQSQRADAAELHLLFARGKRPDRVAIRAFVAEQQSLVISHDPLAGDVPAAEAAGPAQADWLELLRDGLTYDLVGLAPAPHSAFPAITHRFDLPALPDPADYETVLLRPGPHLTGSGSSMPVVRTMLGIACDLVRQFDALAAVCWGPAETAIGRRFFESTTSAWLDGGPFPALGLTAFVETPEQALQSVGLAFWTGQELRVEPPLSADRVAATRLAIRLANHLVLIGGLDADDRITAPDGTRLALRPSPDRALVSVWRE
jgi:hypothetical protein